MAKSIKIQLLLIILTGLLFHSCEKDDYIYRSRKIILNKPELKSDGILLKWTQPLMSNFHQYVITRSKYKNNLQGSYNSIYITDYNTLEYLDNTYPLEDSIYYSITAIGDTTVTSETQLIILDMPESFSFTAYKAFALPIEKKVIVVQNNSYPNKISSFDVEKDAFTITKEFNEYFNFICLGDNGKGKELYFYNSNSESLEILDAITLDKKYSKYLSFGIRALTTDNKGFLYVLTLSGYIYTIKRSDLSVITSNISSSYANLNYYEASNQLITFSYSYMYVHTIGADNKITSTSANNIGSSNSDSEPLIIPGQSVVLSASSTANVYNWLTGSSSQLEKISGTSYFKKLYCDSEYIIGIANYSNIINYYNTTDYSKIGTVISKAAPYIVTRVGEYIIAIGSSTSYYNNSIIEKIKI